MKLRDHWARYYDPKHGTEIEDIQKHFNLHRGRWWSYYDRGSVYLTYGHYDKAIEDFNEAIVKRSRDKWDARTYGMHFIDYFPHRETGVTNYFQGVQETDVTEKERLLGKAICELEKSLSQEESSRAKFYLNEARRSLLQVAKEKDKIPPTIHVKKPIYTNRRTVQFYVTVTDQDSYVEDIRIGSACGDVTIDKPRLFVELAKKKVEEKVEFTIGPYDKYAVVTITASDLAGNESDPDNTLIIVDTQSPTAFVAIAGDTTQPDSPVEVSIEAMDHFGLKQIQVGEDPNNKVACDGAMKYSDTIAGMPRGGELAITVVDNAGNEVVTNIPVEEDTEQNRLAIATRPQTSRRLLLTKMGNWNRPLSPAYLPAPGFPMPRSLMPHFRGGYAGIDSPGAFHAPADGGGTDRRQPEFHFPPHVVQFGGKETSQDVFYVDGTLRNVESFDKIRINASYEVDGETKDIPYEIKKSETISGKRNIIFSQMVDLNDVPVNSAIDIKVEAYCEPNVAKPCAEETVLIKKRNDCSRDPNAIYGMLLLPLRNDGIVSELSEEDVSMLGHIYDIVLESLKKLKMYDRKSGKCSKRFDIYDLNEVGRASEITKWFKLSEKDYSHKKTGIIHELQSRQTGMKTGEHKHSVIDLVIDGKVKLTNTNGEKRFEVTLRAIDVSSTKLIRFPGIGIEDKTPILGDVYGKTKDLKSKIDGLASKVGDRFPRLHTEVTNINQKKQFVEIGYGKRNRLFPQMKLSFYDGGGMDRNAVLKSICQGKIINLDWYSCKIRPNKNIEFFEDDEIVITK